MWSLDQSRTYGDQCAKEFLAKKQNGTKAICPQDNVLETDKNEEVLYSLKALADGTAKIQSQREKFTRITKQIELAVTARDKLEKEVEAAENRVREAQKLVAAAEKVRKETEEKTRKETFEQEKVIKNTFDAKHELREITKKIESAKNVVKQNDLKSLENLLETKQNDLKSLENLFETKQNDLKSLENLLETKQNDIKSAENLLETKQNDIKSAENLIETKRGELAALDAEINARKCKLKELSSNKSEVPSPAPNVPEHDEQPAATIPPERHINSSGLGANEIRLVLENMETPQKPTGKTKRLTRKRSVSQSAEKTATPPKKPTNRLSTYEESDSENPSTFNRLEQSTIYGSGSSISMGYISSDDSSDTVDRNASTPKTKKIRSAQSSSAPSSAASSTNKKSPTRPCSSVAYSAKKATPNRPGSANKKFVLGSTNVKKIRGNEVIPRSLSRELSPIPGPSRNINLPPLPPRTTRSGASSIRRAPQISIRKIAQGNSEGYIGAGVNNRVIEKVVQSPKSDAPEEDLISDSSDAGSAGSSRTVTFPGRHDRSMSVFSNATGFRLVIN